MRKTVIVGIICLAVGLIVGWYAGRFMLERYWSQPLVLKRLAAADVERSKGDGADPVPALGTMVFRPAPLERTRMVLAELTRQDPLVVTLGDVGTGSSESRLNLDLTNRGKCAIASFSGVAYGFDAYGTPSRLNKGGEHFVAFSQTNLADFKPASSHLLSVKLRNRDNASLVVAHVDEVTCTDGTRWTRKSPAS